MFRVAFHPSSGAHNTISTVSLINETCTAICRERGWAGTQILQIQCYEFLMMGETHPKHVEQLTDLNKL